MNATKIVTNKTTQIINLIGGYTTKHKIGKLRVDVEQRLNLAF